MEIILSRDLIKMAEYMTTKPAMMRQMMVDKTMLTVTLTVEEVLEEQSVLWCESAHELLPFGPTGSFHWTK